MNTAQKRTAEMTESLGDPPGEEMQEEPNLFISVGWIRKKEALEEFKLARQ